MLAAVMPTFNPSICSLSWLEMSVQRSARADETANANNTASMAASRIGGRENENVIVAAPQAPGIKTSSGQKAQGIRKIAGRRKSPGALRQRGFRNLPFGA